MIVGDVHSIPTGVEAVSIARKDVRIAHRLFVGHRAPHQFDLGADDGDDKEHRGDQG